MKTMPLTTVRVMRAVTEFMLTRIAVWEDKYADPTDYRMRELNTGLWQASQSMKAIIEGDFEPMRRQLPLPEAAVLGRSYVDELLGDAPVPLRTIE